LKFGIYCLLRRTIYLVTEKGEAREFIVEKQNAHQGYLWRYFSGSNHGLLTGKNQ
jgi:hypothetical protein